MKTKDEVNLIGPNGEIYYTLNIAYILNDEDNILSKGSIWDKDVAPPDEVTLGKRIEKYQWEELINFAKTFNSINGLILEINRLCQFNEKISRDTTTLQGGLNQIKDITNSFRNLNPGDIVQINDRGQLKGIKPLLKDYPVIDTENTETYIQNGDSLNIALSKIEKRLAKLGV